MTNVSLLEQPGVARRYIRMSEAGHCSLRIAHHMLGTGERRRRMNDMGLRLGTHLESMVTEYLADQGLTVYYAKALRNGVVVDEQLEIVQSDPPMMGHNDGIVAYEQDEPTWWMEHNMPGSVLQSLLTGEPHVLEIKVLNETNFDAVKRFGLKNAGSFMSLYWGQIHTYAGALLNESDDEMWLTTFKEDGKTVDKFGSDSFKTLLAEKGWQRPRRILITLFCPELKEFAFEVTEYDAAYDNALREKHRRLIATLNDGLLPAPDHDGKHSECYMCPFSYACPAAQDVMRERAHDNLPVVAQERVDELEELADKYAEFNRQEASAKKEKKRIRRAMEEIVGNRSGTFVTPNHVVKFVATKGRRNIDTAAVGELLGKENVPYKTGQPTIRLYVEPLYGASSEELGSDDDEES